MLIASRPRRPPIRARRKSRRASTAPDIVPPAPERIRRGEVEALERPIADDAGRPSRPWRAVDTLAIMFRRGSITAEMRQAGEDFRDKFRYAQLDPLHSADMRRLSSIGNRDPGPSGGIEAAREWVWLAIRDVGGLGSPCGSCLWSVLGWGQSLREWAIETGWKGRKIDVHSAAAFLIAALGILVAKKRA